MLLSDIGDYLETEGVGVVHVDIFKGMMPDQPDNCTSLFEYAGKPPDLHWDGEYPGLQVRVRNKSYEAGRIKIDSIYKTLHGLNEQTLGTTRYLLIKSNGSPESIGRDKNDRVEFVCNFSVIKER